DRVAHPHPELETGETRLGHLEQRGADPPPLADHRAAHVEAAHREVLAEGGRIERDAEAGAPPAVVLDRVRIDRLVRAAVDAEVRLAAAGDVRSLGPQPPV